MQLNHSFHLGCEQSKVLLKAAVKTIPLSTCNTTILKYNEGPNAAAFRNGISGGQYCALGSDGTRDSCSGDSGGPLQIIGNNSTTTATVVGVVSIGITCGGPLPGIYTRVASYIKWIESIAWPDGISTL